jgi:hypothetical protein
MTDRTGSAHDDTLDELAVGWALHSLDPADEARFAEHLPGCAHCRAVVDDTVAAMGALGTAVAVAEPPAGLRSRVREAVAATDQLPQPVPLRPRAPRRWVSGALVAAAAAAVVGLGVWNVQLDAARDEAQARAAAQAAVVDTLLEQGPATLVPVTDDDGRAVATVLTRDEATQLITHGLPANDQDEDVYVLWGVVDDSPEALGTFDVDGDAPTLQPIVAEAPSGTYDGYGISLEPGRSAPPAPTEIVASGS